MSGRFGRMGARSRLSAGRRRARPSGAAGRREGGERARRAARTSETRVVGGGEVRLARSRHRGGAHCGRATRSRPSGGAGSAEGRREKTQRCGGEGVRARDGCGKRRASARGASARRASRSWMRGGRTRLARGRQARGARGRLGGDGTSGARPLKRESRARARTDWHHRGLLSLVAGLPLLALPSLLEPGEGENLLRERGRTRPRRLSRRSTRRVQARAGLVAQEAFAKLLHVAQRLQHAVQVTRVADVVQPGAAVAFHRASGQRETATALEVRSRSRRQPRTVL